MLNKYFNADITRYRLFGQNIYIYL